MDLVLPFPDAAFSPNARNDRRSIAGKVRAAKEVGFWAVREAIGRAHPWFGRPPAGPIDVVLVWVPKANHRFDQDNLLARMKPYLDGIAQGLGVNDRQFRIVRLHIAAKQPKPGTFVALREASA